LGRKRGLCRASAMRRGERSRPERLHCSAPAAAWCAALLDARSPPWLAITLHRRATDRREWLYLITHCVQLGIFGKIADSAAFSWPHYAFGRGPFSAPLFDDNSTDTIVYMDSAAALAPLNFTTAFCA